MYTFNVNSKSYRLVKKDPSMTQETNISHYIRVFRKERYNSYYCCRTG